MRSKIAKFIVADDDAEVYRAFGYDVSSPLDIRDAIAATPKGETLTLEINSYGGDVLAGYEMYSVLKAAQIPTVAEIQSISASAASTAMLGCDTVNCSPVAQVMIHLPSSGGSGGNQSELGREIQKLDSITEGVLNAYELKCGGKKSRAELRAMLDAETWLSAAASVECGLVDNILYDIGGNLGGFQNSLGGLPDAAELRSKQETEHSGKFDTLKNQLAIEKMRY